MVVPRRGPPRARRSPRPTREAEAMAARSREAAPAAEHHDDAPVRRGRAHPGNAGARSRRRRTAPERRSRMSIGSFCLVLHGHLPYVLRHGIWPHGEDWLYEAAAETYLPLLATLRECEFLNGNPARHGRAHPDPAGAARRTTISRRASRSTSASAMERARRDRAGFEREGNAHLRRLARAWETFYAERAEQFDAIDGDIAARLCRRSRAAESSRSSPPAPRTPTCRCSMKTPASTPRCGRASPARAASWGFEPTGVWLPECAYRPPGPWYAPIPWGQPRNRPGTDQVIAAAGSRPLLRRAPPGGAEPQRVGEQRRVAQGGLGGGGQVSRPRVARRARTGARLQQWRRTGEHGGFRAGSRDLRAGVVGRRRAILRTARTSSSTRSTASATDCATGGSPTGVSISATSSPTSPRAISRARPRARDALLRRRSAGASRAPQPDRTAAASSWPASTPNSSGTGGSRARGSCAT